MRRVYGDDDIVGTDKSRGWPRGHAGGSWRSRFQAVRGDPTGVLFHNALPLNGSVSVRPESRVERIVE